MDLRSITLFLLFFFVALLALFLTIVLGDRAAWYLAWVMGTAMIVLIAASGATLLDIQEDEEARNDSSRRGQSSSS